MRKNEAPHTTLTELLGLKYPGQDVLVRFRTRDNRSMGGYWCWSLTELCHVHTPRAVIKKMYPTKIERDSYHSRILMRHWRWRDVIKMSRKPTT